MCYFVQVNCTCHLFGSRWHQQDTVPGEDMETVFAILSDLRPYTQYAVYVQTYTVSSESRGAWSPIVYFKTKPYST